MPGRSLIYTETIHQSPPFDNVLKTDFKKEKKFLPQPFYEWKKDSISPEVLALPF